MLVIVKVHYRTEYIHHHPCIIYVTSCCTFTKFSSTSHILTNVSISLPSKKGGQLPVIKYLSLNRDCSITQSEGERSFRWNNSRIV